MPAGHGQNIDQQKPDHAPKQSDVHRRTRSKGAAGAIKTENVLRVNFVDVIDPESNDFTTLTHSQNMTTTMTSHAEPQANVRLNFNNRDYEFSELPRNAQLLLQDIMRLDQQIGKLQFELRHLQAARQVYGSNLRQAMNDDESAESDHLVHDGTEHHQN
jgi:hypothetical protein